MAKNSAFGTTFGMGTRQVETAVCVTTATGNGNITVTITSASVAGSPLDTVVAILSGDTATMWAAKIRTALNLVAAITLNFIVGGTGANVTLTRKLAAADATLNIAIADTGATGITPVVNSTDTTPGVATVSVAQVTNIGGPGMASDTVDVTTHDSTGAWEETVVSILRSGEVALDLVFDPADNTQDFTAAGGLGTIMADKSLRHYTLTFPGPVVWTFPAYVTAFEPSAPHDGALTATTTLKISGAPVLA